MPFNSNASSISASFLVGFQPQLLLGIDTFSHYISGGVGVFFDVPAINVTISELKHVNDKCEAASNKPLSGHLINIVPVVEVDFGVEAAITANVIDFETSKETAATLLSTAITLPTECLSYDGTKHTYAAAKAVQPSITVTSRAITATSSAITATSSAKPKHNAASSLTENTKQHLIKSLTAGFIILFLVLIVF